MPVVFSILRGFGSVQAVLCGWQVTVGEEGANLQQATLVFALKNHGFSQTPFGRAVICAGRTSAEREVQAEGC